MPGEIQNAPPQPITFGKYTLLERISHGGMAEVFRAKTQGTAGFERTVAIKVLLPNVADDGDFITMLIDEAKIAGQLSHANIAQIFDLGQVEGRYYIVQEYVPGRDLRAILHYLEDRRIQLSVAQSCHIILKVCEALDYAHNKRDQSGQPLNLVHRDISPQNVIVSHEGEVKLIDFGIVKAEGRQTRTLAGLVKGKFAYMSPEQIRGLPVDRRSDVFACGIILHELLTGQPLFKRSTEFETLQRARAGEIPPPSRINPEVSPDLDRVTLRALARHVDDRYQSAIALRDDLWEVVRAHGYYYSRDHMSVWMLSTFGEPSMVEVEGPSAPGRAAAAPPLRAPAERSGYDDDDVENKTVVDSPLHERLLQSLDDSYPGLIDSQLTLPDELKAGDSGLVPAVRDLAFAVHEDPQRGELRPSGSAPSFTPDSLLDIGVVSGDGPSDDETTSARLALGRRTKSGPGSPSAWIEPQTPTKRRDAVPDEVDAEDSTQLADDDTGLRTRERSIPEVATTTSGELPALLPPLPMPVQVAGPDHPTIGPGRAQSPLPGGRPMGPLPSEPAFQPMAPPHAGHHGSGMRPPLPMPQGSQPIPHEPLAPGPPLWQADPGISAGGFGAPVDASAGGFGAPADVRSGGYSAPVDVRSAASRYLVAGAIAVLVAAMTISIILAVTGS